MKEQTIKEQIEVCTFYNISDDQYNLAPNRLITEDEYNLFCKMLKEIIKKQYGN